MLVFAIVLSIVVTVIVMLPFVIGRGGILASAQSLNSIPQLEGVKKAIIQRYLEDEAAFHDRLINQYMWQQRRMVLINRYVDATRRLDILSHIEKSGSGS